MIYADIIQNNCKFHSPVSWWPRFAFHYTDVQNAVSILDSGYLYSRQIAEDSNVMKNDNASRQVIKMTNPTVKSYVRFYFRPLTPTQFHNEGFKHPQVRFQGDANANVPMPVFFLFDLEKVLQMKDTQFSETEQAGYGAVICSTISEFEKFEFQKIYSIGPMSGREMIKYRQAEILYPHCFAVRPYLKAILCRNNIERTTFLQLLKDKNKKNYNCYKDIVSVRQDDLFENNGLYVTNCQYNDNTVSISYSDTLAKKSYTRKYGSEPLTPIPARAEFEWLNNQSSIMMQFCNYQIDYKKSTGTIFKLGKHPVSADVLAVRLYIDNVLMCNVRHWVKDTIIF